MAKIICKTLDGSLLQSNQYATPKGNIYVFMKGIPTDVKDKDDIEFFLKAGNGELFERIDSVKKAIKKVKKIVENEKPAKFLDEDEKTPNPNYPWTDKELKKLNKRQQIELIKRIAGSNTRIPHYEKDRIALIKKYLPRGV